MDNLYIVTKLHIETNEVTICDHFHDELNSVHYLNKISNEICGELQKEHLHVFILQITPSRYEIYARNDGWIYSVKQLVCVVQLIIVKEKLTIERVE